MEAFMSTQLTIPFLQIALMLALSTVSLLIGRLKLALIINYCFTLYWGYIANIDLFGTEGMMALNTYTFLYSCFGLLIVFLAMVGLIMQRE